MSDDDTLDGEPGRGGAADRTGWDARSRDGAPSGGTGSDEPTLGGTPPRGTRRDWLVPDEADRTAPPVRPRRPRPAQRRAAVRRRRLVALAVLVAVVVAVVALTLRACGGDQFVGTWKKSGSSGLIIAKIAGDRYSVTNLRGKARTTAVRKGDTLTIKRHAGGTTRAITLTPGSQADTLEEHFPDGTSDVLTRQ